jgi:hypothetical protein
MPSRPILESKNGIKIRLPILVTETLGMRYFFHVSAEGSDEYHRFHVLAVDEDGNEITRMPVVVPS